MARDLRDELVAKRQARVAKMGHAEGVQVPRRREMPIVPFLDGDGLIGEIKRRSPSQGEIAPGLDVVRQAEACVAAGVGQLSVITEPEGFGGGVEDLIRIKRALPQTPVMRRDFLFDNDDMDISWRAGADAVLLVAGIMTEDRLHMLHRCAKSLGMEAVVEIQNEADVAKAAPLKPDRVAVNSRDSSTFVVDPLLPLRVRAAIDWDARIIYESGVTHPDQAAFVAGAGFRNLLVGKAVVREPSLSGDFAEALRTARPARFWPETAKRLGASPSRPLIAVGGLTRESDALLASDLGADILGFVFDSRSPRDTDPELVRVLRDTPALKVATPAETAGTIQLPPALRHLLEDGLVDAVQFRGHVRPETCFQLWPVNYTAFCPAAAEEVVQAEACRCPRILLDAAAAEPGASERRVMPDVLDAWHHPLWLAGGITPDNVGRIIETRRPELLEIGAGVEESPGVKNPEKLRKFFKIVSQS